jgi:hypothetical protein
MATTGSTDGAGGGTDRLDDRLVQLLEQVVAHQARSAGSGTDRVGPPRAPAGLNPAQRRLVLEFRALRNGLGNLARHGDQTVVLMRRPQLNQFGILTFADPLPPGSANLRIFDRNGTQLDERHVSGGTTSVENVGEAASVQIDDHQGEPILLGFPVLTFVFESSQEPS